MRIVIVTEIFNSGGIDTFLVNLINNWPVAGDQFVVIANWDYPGLTVIERQTTRRLEVIRHRIFVYSRLLSARGLASGVMLALSPILRYLVIMYEVLAFRTLLGRANADVLMVVNGGYPGGDSCRAAAISWGLFSGKRASIHNFHNLVQRPPWYLSLQEAVLDQVLCRFTQRFVTVSKAAAQSMAVRPAIIKNSVIRYIYNGIREESGPAAEGDIRTEIGISSTAPLCLMLGTYEPRKGHHFLLEAFSSVLKAVPDAHLLVCGFGSPTEVAQVRQLVAEFGLDQNVHLMGFRHDTSALLANADVLLVASQAYESFGFTSVEAMAHRVPVVATDVGGIPEVVVNGEGGYCVGRQDVESYAGHVVSLLQNADQRREQGERGYRRYREMFTAEVMASNYSNMLNELGFRS